MAEYTEAVPPAGPDVENIHSVVRQKPSQLSQSITKVDEASGTIQVTNPTNDSWGPKIFQYDKVYGEDAKQSDVYNTTVKPIVESVLRGYHGTVMCYGATGSGKTYTTLGDLPEQEGIIPRSFTHIFDHIDNTDRTARYLMYASCYEIYQLKLCDLLDDRKEKHVKENKHMVYVEDLFMIPVTSACDMTNVLQKALKNRSLGIDDLHYHYSQSDFFFIITIECSETGKDGSFITKQGRLTIVDMKGSERQRKTHPNGDKLKESCSIGMSLSSFGMIISALVSNVSHIPYRDSKTTRMLRNSLGGFAKTCMITCINSDISCFDDTVSSLRYAQRAKSVKNKPKVNVNPIGLLCAQVEKDLENLRRVLASGTEGSHMGSVVPERSLNAFSDFVKYIHIKDDVPLFKLHTCNKETENSTNNEEICLKNILLIAEQEENDSTQDGEYIHFI